MSFPQVVAKLLYVSIRARMDLLLAVSFLTTRVSKSTTEDQAKLKRVLEYINGTMDHTYTLGADKLGKVRTWVDASYAVHPDMKSHTGGVMSFGIGGLSLQVKQTETQHQKLNGSRSGWAQVITCPIHCGLKISWRPKDTKSCENYFEQDNESAIKLEKNGTYVRRTQVTPY
jgi:hypothetical protein